MSTQMSVFLSQEAAQPQWGARAILSFSEAGATIHIGEGHDLGAVQRAGRTLDGQGIAFVSLRGEGWDLESVWAFYQGYRGPKKKNALEWDALSEADQTELDALEVILKGDFTEAQKAHYGIVVLVDRDGQIEVTEGLVRKEDQAAAIEAGILAKSRHEGSSTPAPKTPISAKLQGDLDRIVTGSRQNALLDDPKLALHLLAFQLTNRMGYHRAFGISTTDVPNAPSTETGFDLDKRLVPTESGYSYESDLAGDFAKFRKRGDKKIMDLLQNALVAKLSIGNADLGAALDKLTTRETRAHFTPTAENFFGRVSGPYLCGLWNDLLDLAADHPTATNFAKKKKGEKAEALDSLFNDQAFRDTHSVTAEQSAKIKAWLPEGIH